MSGIHVEIYGQGQPLVMIHGWAMHSGVWRAFAEQLAQHRRVICVDLPGHGRSEALLPFTLDTVSAALLQAVSEERFSVLGWSLGATVAMAMAQHAPDRVKNLIVLAGNPHFVQAEDWPGVKPEVLDGFAELLQADVAQTLMRFLALQVNGLSHGKQLLQTLKQVMQECPPPAADVLQGGLDILKSADLREFILRNPVPVKMILGDRDTLIPLASAERVRQINSGVDVQILESAGHAPFLSHPEVLINAINNFL